MRRFVWAIAALAVLVGAGLVAAPHLLPRELVKTRVAEQISAWTGRAVSLRGDPVVRLFPAPTVTLSDVRIAGPEGMDDTDMVQMEALRGRLRLLPLIIGEIEIDSFELVRPRVRLVRDEAPWVFLHQLTDVYGVSQRVQDWKPGGGIVLLHMMLGEVSPGGVGP